MSLSSGVNEEQAFVDVAYETLGRLVEHLRMRMVQVTSAPDVGTRQGELESEALFHNLVRQLKSAEAASSKLCFGRIDTQDADSLHIGRIGLRDDSGHTLLIDWRAPAAAGFYQATAVNPMGIVLRRRIIAKDRQVVHIEDEFIDDPIRTASDGADGAAARSVEAPRDGRMSDIIATIAADQDAIVRSPLGSITVVEGGPGTGKTVVALHRAAWLLYTYRDRLEKDGVLVIGPSSAFLHYIEQVLPSLGETDVVLLTPGQLFPGVSATEVDDTAVAAIKGDVRMAKVLARAVKQRQRVPDFDVTITLADTSSVRITAAQLRAAQSLVPAGATFHAGREPFLTDVLDKLARDRCRRMNHDPSDNDHRLAARDDIIDDVNVRRTLNLMWLPITPTRLVTLLLSDAQTLARAAEGILTSEEQALLLGTGRGDWTVDDVPLLDEAAYLLGEFTPPRRVEPASGPLDYPELYSGEPAAASGLSTVAERALQDREWIYGHVIVDEAQELSRMAWHCVARRCSRKSMTIVGDLQQTTHPAGANDWAQALAGIDREYDLHTLTVTYRITKQTARTAIELLMEAGGSEPSLRPIRDGEETEREMSSWLDLSRDLRRIIGSSEGRACVVLPDEFVTEVGLGLVAKDVSFGFGDNALDSPIAVLSARDTKGLEFDTVIVVDPASISQQSVAGSDIYVACTRATKRLVLVSIVR